VALARAEHKEGDYMGAGVITRRAAISGKSKSVDLDGIYDRHYSNKNCGFLLDARVRVREALVRFAAVMTLELMAKTPAKFDCWRSSLKEICSPNI
jgi:hypothetical protein